MSLAHKLYKIGTLVSKDDIRELIEVTEFKEKDYVTLQINFEIKNNTLIKPPEISKSSLDNLKTMFTKKIGGTSNSYYLYPNFEYQKEKDLYKKFKAIAYTFENSVLLYANEANRKLGEPIFEYITNYSEDILQLKEEPVGNYFLVITINGKSVYELMPEIWNNYFDDFVEPHISKKVKGVNTPQLKEEIDFITHKKALCGYNPNVKFFTMDNYNDSFKPQIINKLPMSKETATAIKKGWMYAIHHLKFYHKGLEYIIIPSMVHYEKSSYVELLTLLKDSKNIESIASNEDFFARLASQILEINPKYINSIALDILFTEVNLTNLSVKIFATLEDVLPSKINYLVRLMEKQKISGLNYIDGTKKSYVYLKNYFGETESFAKATKSKGLDNKVKQEKIALAKILLGYGAIQYHELLKRFEKHREINYNYKEHKVEKNLIESHHETGIKVMAWLEHPQYYIDAENRVLTFLDDLQSIQYQGDK